MTILQFPAMGKVNEKTDNWEKLYGAIDRLVETPIAAHDAVRIAALDIANAAIDLAEEFKPGGST